MRKRGAWACFIAVLVAAIAVSLSLASDLYIHLDESRAVAVYPGVLVGMSLDREGKTHHYKVWGKTATIVFEHGGQAKTYSIQMRDTETYGMIP